MSETPSPPPPGRKTGPVPAPPARTTRATPAASSPAVPPATARIPNGPRTTQAGATPRRSSQRALLAAAAAAGAVLVVVLLVLLTRPPPPLPPLDVAKARADYARAYKDFRDGRYAEADRIVEDLLARLPGFRNDTEEGRSLVQEVRLRHQSEIHPEARMEEEGNPKIDAWLREARAALEIPELSDEAADRVTGAGRDLRERMPRHPRIRGVEDHLDRLEAKRAAAKKPGDAERYKRVMEEVRRHLQDERFDSALARLRGFLLEKDLGGFVRGQAVEQVARVNGLALDWLRKQAIAAERLRDEGTRDAGLRRLEEARPRLAGTDAAPRLEEVILDFAGKK